METEENLEKIREEARKFFEDSCPSHDFTHTERVLQLAVQIGKKENADLHVLKLAALLHDIGRKKEMENPEESDHSLISAELASSILEKNDIDKKTAEQVLHCISSHRFRNNKKPETKEAKILFDADKLDSIGAIGVARAYAWAGKQGIRLYSDKDYLGTGYEKKHSPVTEFKYKLSKIKQTLFTETAKEIAEKRNIFMENFFKQLEQEVSNWEKIVEFAEKRAE